MRGVSTHGGPESSSEYGLRVGISSKPESHNGPMWVIECTRTSKLLRFITHPKVPALAKTREAWLRKSRKLNQQLSRKINREERRGNPGIRHFVHFRTRQIPGGVGWRRATKRAVNGEDHFRQLPTKPVVSPLLFHLATTRVLCWTPARERRRCRPGHPQRESLDNRLGRLTVRLSQIFRNSTPSCPTLHTPRFTNLKIPTT